MNSRISAVVAAHQHHKELIGKSPTQSWAREDAYEADTLHRHHNKTQKAEWSAWRTRLHGIVTGQICETVLAVVISFNMVLVIIEADSLAAGDLPQWVEQASQVLLAFYTLELLLKMAIYQRDFATEIWNVVDFFVVSLDIIMICIQLLGIEIMSFGFLRVFRLARLMRTLKVATVFPELNQLLRGFMGAIRAIFWGVSMVFLMLTAWGILAVHIVHPVNLQVVENNPAAYDGCERCGRAFSTVGHSIVTFFQTLVAGDSWGTVAVPIIEQQPLVFLYFLAVLVTVELVMLNLILAVIVEAAMHAQEMQINEEARVKDEEFMDGYHTNEEFSNCLKIMEITEADMGMVFTICDEDGSGEVSYNEFILQLRRLKSQPHQLILFYVSEVRSKVLELGWGKRPPGATNITEKLADGFNADHVWKNGAPKSSTAKLEGEVAAAVLIQPQPSSHLCEEAPRIDEEQMPDVLPDTLEPVMPQTPRLGLPRVYDFLSRQDRVPAFWNAELAASIKSLVRIHDELSNLQSDLTAQLGEIPEQPSLPPSSPRQKQDGSDKDSAFVLQNMGRLCDRLSHVLGQRPDIERRTTPLSNGSIAVGSNCFPASENLPQTPSGDVKKLPPAVQLKAPWDVSVPLAVKYSCSDAGASNAIPTALEAAEGPTPALRGTSL
eukprot:TRINITY_DN14936_c0_g1_i2.p1 TRINITY_DN14936_c0_g1~~TRINITY_DN14936_c0_g1_i2.p1  ORF type:complete len:663 (-),score=148.51 TRINITY_DN14936_c0_g1_i2:170-2158(-)